MTTRIECMLPDKPSELIRLALADLEKIEADPRYEVDMSTWHKPEFTFDGQMRSVCAVCFAGAVMAKTCNIPLEELIQPEQFEEDQMNKFAALDAFRSGRIESGLRWMHIPMARMPDYVSIHDYSGFPSLFKDDMAKLALMFEKVGL